VLFLNSIGENTYIAGAFTGIKAAACALILYSAFRIGKQVVRGKFALALAGLSFAMIVFFKVTAVWAVLAGALLGLLYTKVKEASR
jgi:chromate transporter